MRRPAGVRHRPPAPGLPAAAATSQEIDDGEGPARPSTTCAARHRRAARDGASSTTAAAGRGDEGGRLPELRWPHHLHRLADRHAAAPTAPRRSSATTSTTRPPACPSTAWCRSGSPRTSAREESRSGSTPAGSRPTRSRSTPSTGSFASVYAAYFTYDADTVTAYRGQRGDNYTVTVGSGENRRTETRIRWRRVRAPCPTTSTTWPCWPTTAWTASTSPRSSRGRPRPPRASTPSTSPATSPAPTTTTSRSASARPSSASTPRSSSPSGATSAATTSASTMPATRYRDLTYKHLLLPIWLLTVLSPAPAYQVFINGVTGEVQGQRPWSKVKIAAAVVAATILVVILVILYSRCRATAGRRRAMGALIVIALVAVARGRCPGGRRPATVKRQQGRFAAANEVVPGVPTSAPASWAGSHDPEARLHRRLRDAMASLRAGPSASTVRRELRVELEQQALALDESLVAIAGAPLAQAHRPLARVTDGVEAVERAVAEVAGAAAEEATARLEAAVADLRTQQVDLAEIRGRSSTVPASSIAWTRPPRTRSPAPSGPDPPGPDQPHIAPPPEAATRWSPGGVRLVAGWGRGQRVVGCQAGRVGLEGVDVVVVARGSGRCRRGPRRKRCWTESSSGKSTARPRAGASRVRRSTSMVISRVGSASMARSRLLADLGGRPAPAPGRSWWRCCGRCRRSGARRRPGSRTAGWPRRRARGDEPVPKLGPATRMRGPGVLLLVEHEVPVVAPLGEQALLEAGALDLLEPVATG